MLKTLRPSITRRSLEAPPYSHQVKFKDQRLQNLPNLCRRHRLVCGGGGHRGRRRRRDHLSSSRRRLGRTGRRLVSRILRGTSVAHQRTVNVAAALPQNRLDGHHWAAAARLRAVGEEPEREELI